MTNQEENQSEPQFYQIDGNTYFVNDKNEMFRLDFDNNKQVYKSMSSIPPEIKKKDIMTNEDEPLSEDLTNQQYRENYWLESKETKTDGSTAMMETRIAKCVEAGGSKEECSRKVKAEMKQKGSENTNTEDMDDKKPKEEEEDEETKKVEVCEKEYDFLKEKYEEFKKLQDEKKKMETDMTSMKDKFAEWGTIMQKVQEERALELAQKRQEKIKKIATDFILPEDELKEDSIKELIENPDYDKVLDFAEKILTKAGKKAKETSETVDTVDLTDFLSQAQKDHDKLMAHYDLRRRVD